MDELEQKGNVVNRSFACYDDSDGGTQNSPSPIVNKKVFFSLTQQQQQQQPTIGTVIYAQNYQIDRKDWRNNKMWFSNYCYEVFSVTAV